MLERLTGGDWNLSGPLRHESSGGEWREAGSETEERRELLETEESRRGLGVRSLTESILPADIILTGVQTAD